MSAKAGGYDFGNKMCTNTQPLSILVIARCGMNKILVSFSAPSIPSPRPTRHYTVALLLTSSASW